MPSSHSSASGRPSSPRSPRLNPTSYMRRDLLQSPSSRAQVRQSFTQQRLQQAQNPGLRLSALPRFHPANFPSAHSSVANTPSSGPTSPQAPLSPGMQQKMYNDAQKRLFLYQRETCPGRTNSTTSPREKPDSPRLVPLGSPGPVTPLELELEEQVADNYLAAGTRASGRPTFQEQDDSPSKRTRISPTFGSVDSSSAVRTQ